MAIYAIGDLHLPGGAVKPMDVFGEHWADHFKRISDDWRTRVGDGDVVLLPGDISWAMTLDEARGDLQAIGRLPGRKVLIRGNHDYWWSSIGRVRDALAPDMYAIQNDALRLDDVILCGTRGWLLPGEEASEADVKIYERELLRLNMSLTQARRISAELPVVCMMHYPPLMDACRDTGFVELLERYGVEDLVYGHLHGAGLRGAFRGEYRGVRFHQVSCDGLDFKLYLVRN